jgi:phosphatidylserine decarboxylase
MRKPTAAFCPEGLPATGLAVLLTLVLAVLGHDLSALAAFVATALVVNFFRDPERVVPAAPGLAVSPADGRVVLVGPARDPFSGEERTRVCVFMNVFNVHVNRSPVRGAVSRMAYHPGKFLNASLDKASEHNERLAWGLTDPEGREWSVVQIAGLIARRIAPWAEEGDDLERGQRLGMIRFGSRVDVYLPSDYHPSVTVGKKVLAGQTVLASLKPGNPA